MSDRNLKWLAWSIAFSTTLLSVLTEFVVYLNPGPKVGARLGTIGIVVPLAIVAAIIVSRLPRNRIGWLLCLAAVGAFQAFAGAVGEYALARQPGSLIGVWLAWLSSWIAFPGIALNMLALLLFPTGNLLSPRWGWAIWLGAVGTASICVGFALFPGHAPLVLNRAIFDNPIGLSGGERPLTILLIVGWTLFFGSAFAAVASLIVRMRRAREKERQQLKWLAYSSAISIPLYLISSFLPTFPRDLLAAVAAPLMPIGVGIAILRYHLFDIDLIIRRTLVYGALTIALALVYYASVLLLEQLFRLITGQQQSEIVIVVSTLAIAALFSPLRRRLQELIDRRFYRRKYDAQKVLATFGATVRDEVDLQRLTDKLVMVVEETVQPAQMSLWLRPGNERGIRTMAQGRTKR